jgi:hypothetical protein
VRALIATVLTLAVACCAACSGSEHHDRVYGAPTARLGESLAVVGTHAAVWATR